jgi:iron complex outermembrane receptor protein
MVALARLPGLLVGVSCVAAMAIGGASLAQQGPDPLQAQVAATATFNVPGQPLASALTALGRQAGLQVVFDPASVSGKSTAGVTGTMTVEQALQQLLAGTGMTFRVSSPSSVTVTLLPSSGAIQLDPVQVQGYPVPSQAMIDNLPPPYAGGQVATGGQLGLLGNRDVMDTPFNQTNFTSKKAQNQQAKTIRDVLIDDPSVRAYIQDGGPGADNVWIRGFPVTADNNSYGGLYGMLPFYSVMPEMAERIEVLKGPSAMLNGMPPNGGGSIGGTINVVPKRAPAEPLTQVTANYALAGQFGGHADVARRFGGDKQFGVRANGVFRAGSTAVQYNSDQRALAVLGLDFRGENVRLSSDLGYQYQYIGGVIPDLGVNPGVALPWAPNAASNWGQPWGFKETKDLFGVVRGEIDLTEHVTAYAALGAHDSRFTGFYSGQVIATDFYGTATSRAPFNFPQYRTYLTVDAGLRGFVNTGPIDHEFALTGTALENNNGGNATQGVAFATNIYNPTIIAAPNLATPAANKTSSQSLSSFGLADTLSAADKRIQLTAGVRLQQITASNYNVTTGVQTSGYDANAVSPSVALVFKPWQNVSLYGNWIQGLQPGSVVGAPFANAGEVFPPFKSTQYEVGLKVDLGKVTTTASAFQISQPSVLTNVTSNTQFLGGEQRNQGLELNVFGEPLEGVRLLGGLMLLNAVLTKTQGGLNDGWVAPFSPGLNVNLAGEWDLPFVRGLTLTGRVIYTGSQYIDTTWPRRSLPEWTRFDLGVRYAFENPGATRKLLVARFNVDNVLDADYWQGGSGATSLVLGTPRIFRLSLTADF